METVIEMGEQGQAEAVLQRGGEGERDGSVIGESRSETGGRPTDDALVLSGIEKHYGGVHALKAVDLSVRRGEIHAIVGENGAGKSTLVGVAAGTVAPDAGTVELAGAITDKPTATWSRAQGLAVVYQEPALIPDLTIAENMRIGVPVSVRPSASRQSEWAADRLEPWHDIFPLDPNAFVRNLSAGERFVVEIARALAARPQTLILDEPTEHLLPAGVEALFRQIRHIVETGCSVVYISHRIHEVKRIADRLSVLRDGANRGTFDAADVSENDIVDLIVGRQLKARFPPKPPRTSHEVLASFSGLSGDGFSSIDLEVRRGEIIGIGGIEGNGQRPFLRALAGLNRSHGSVRLNGRETSLRSAAVAARSGIAYLAQDRRHEGVLPGLSVSENVAIRALPKLGRMGFLFGNRLEATVASAMTRFGIKSASPASPIETLSGGNQQKAMLARVLTTEPELILADEPSQGVDVGARAEVYGILREATERGSSVIMLSSDASELEGLCDRVLVFSRGQIVAELDGEAVTERSITQAAVTATTQAHTHRTASFGDRLRRLLDRDIAPAGVLLVTLVLLGLVASIGNEYYFTARSFSLMLPLIGTLIFFGLGQQLVMMTGGVDLSVGPLAGLVSVVASFVIAPQVAGAGLVVGFAVLLVTAVVVGLVNWILVEVFGISPIIATLVTYTAIQGVSLLLRPQPAGSFSDGVTNLLQTSIGFLPVALVVAVLVGVLLEAALYRTLPGLRLRATGSSGAVAAKLGVAQSRVRLAAYVGCSVLTLLGALLLLPQLGSGDALGANDYSLASVTAVVLGGGSIFGGRGSFLGSVLGAALIVQINTVVQFLGLTDYWQQWLLGALTIAAVAVYSAARSTPRRFA